MKVILVDLVLNIGKVGWNKNWATIYGVTSHENMPASLVTNHFAPRLYLVVMR